MRATAPIVSRPTFSSAMARTSGGSGRCCEPPAILIGLRLADCASQSGVGARRPDHELVEVNRICGGQRISSTALRTSEGIERRPIRSNRGHRLDVDGRLGGRVDVQGLLDHRVHVDDVRSRSVDGDGIRCAIRRGRRRRGAHADSSRDAQRRDELDGRAKEASEDDRRSTSNGSARAVRWWAGSDSSVDSTMEQVSVQSRTAQPIDEVRRGRT